MTTVRIAAAQTIEFREDIEGALSCVSDVAARAHREGASLLCFPEGFLQGYLTDEAPARRHALDLTSPAFKAHLLSREHIFHAGNDSHVFAVDGLRFGINICYDTNFSEAARKVAELGASLIVCPANNMHPRKTAKALKNAHNSVRGDRCRETGLWLVSADVTGERDGCISWGPTAVLNPAGEVAAQLPLEKTGLLVFDIPCHP